MAFEDLEITRDAVISPDGVYRYALTRQWAPRPLPWVRWIMLNPSTADAEVDDNTIRRCMRFAHAWGAGGIVVHNLFALRARNPDRLAEADDPIGPENDHHLAGGHIAAGVVQFTVCAWGAKPIGVRPWPGDTRSRADIVLGILRSHGFAPRALGLTADGHPRHPLYMPNSSTPDILPEGVLT